MQSVAQNVDTGTVSSVSSAPASACLSDGVSSEYRRYLQTATEVFPIGVWNLVHGEDLTQVDAPTAIFRILAEEVLGYHVIVSNPTFTSTQTDALHALAGCELSFDSWQCTRHVGRRTKVHAALGISFDSAVQQVFDELNRYRVGGLLEDMGDMGYVIRQGIYVKGPTAAKAFIDRVFLDDYRTYNASQQDFFSLHRYFSNISQMKLDLVPCSEWYFASTDISMNYPSLTEITMNSTGLVLRNRSFGTNSSSNSGPSGMTGSGGMALVAECWNGWWAAKPCRDDINSCFPLVTQRINGVAHNAMSLMTTVPCLVSSFSS